MTADSILARDLRPEEEFRVSWDYVNDLAAGDTITGQSVTAVNSDAVNVTATFLQSPLIAGTTISVQIQAGVDKKDYLVTFKATTANADVFVRTLLVKCRA